MMIVHGKGKKMKKHAKNNNFNGFPLYEKKEKEKLQFLISLDYTYIENAKIKILVDPKEYLLKKFALLLTKNLKKF